MTTGQSELRSKDADDEWVVHEGKLRKIKWRGIHKKATKKPGYVVEFRLPKSPGEKIWMTFGSPFKAMRAFDMVRHLFGKEPYYYVYPQGYLPPRPSEMPSKEIVKSLAEVYAKKPDQLSVNPSCLFPDTSTSAPTRPPTVTVGSHQPTTMPGQGEASNEVLEANVESKEFETKVEPAYIRGSTAANTPAVTDLLGQPFPKCLHVYPPIEGAGYILDAIEETPAEPVDHTMPENHFALAPVSDLLEQPLPEYPNVYSRSEGAGYFLDANEETPTELAERLFPTMPENHFALGSNAFVTAEEWDAFYEGI